ncbi:MAG: hypothetical protein F2934_10325 [Actinobacteria bacterium]|uniref:Unannotated protein n=1 Tax=freshwater metagenome TaxID=449393 RepID=A0A6J6TI05_9ZZZZ|nr:hypothetical protein [Actinomycetota bacterium]MSY12086.1 hypothetical protein [Actinomycetota bacterium]MSZ03546.1 hypothetical protein [Actinomycetota bacterium]MTB07510.1 hypothetical protein [Actinomycetota bacterium]
MIVRLHTVRHLLALFAVVVGLLLQGQLSAGTAVAAARRSGDAEAVQAKNRLRPFIEGTHESAFSLRLPRGATCPGDSMNDDWRVQSFVVPSTDDPGSLRYMVTGPEGPENDARVALYTSEGRPYMNQLLGANSEPGQPAQIIELPSFSFKRLPINYLPSGEYRMGVACTDGKGVTAQYWDTLISIESSPTTMQWRTLQKAENLDKRSNTLWIVLAVVCVLVLIVSVATFVRASRAQRATIEKDVPR